MTGTNIFYKHLRVFDCRAYFHIPKDIRLKLDHKAKECIFSGYGHEKFEYKLWDLMVRKLIKNRDVVFLENQIVGDTEKSDKSQSSLEIPIIPISVSLSIVYYDHKGAREITMIVQQN